VKIAALLMMTAAVCASAAFAAAPTEIHIPGERIVPKSLTSSKDGTIYIGSIVARTIFRVKPGADTAAAWIQPGTGGLQNILGVFADDVANTLWACSVSFGASPSAATAAPSELFAFNLRSGAIKGRYPFPTPGAMCNDIAIGPDGSVFATDTNNMEIVRLKRGATVLEVWTPNHPFGSRGGVLDGISVLKKTVFVSTLSSGKVFSVPIAPDGRAGSVTQVKLDRAINHPDGMRAFGSDSVLIIEGGGAGRLSRIRFDAQGGKVTTLGEGFPDGPVAVTVVGDMAYVLEGQFKLLKPAPDQPARPFRATAVVVGKP
jgi:sugar lactone lactonase YvrE